MFWQTEYVREAVSMTLNSTYTLELPDTGLLGSLFFRISGSQASGYGQSGGDWRIVDEISKIEIIGNGSTVIKSYDAYNMNALAAWDQGVMPPDAWRNYATNTQFFYSLMNFGRKLYDPALGLDLNKWNTVELKVTNTATSSDFSDLTISVLGLYARDLGAGGFGGYMRSEEWRSWTTVADETKYNTIPTDHVLRRLMVQAIPGVDASNVENTNMANLMDDVELSLDTGQVRVYKGGIDDILRLNYYDLGKPLIAGGFPYMTADKGIDISLGYVHLATAGAGSQDGAGAGTIATIESGRTSFTQKPETYEADSPQTLIVAGVAPFLTGLFRFDHDPNPGTWLDPKARQSVLLNIHTRDASSAASGTNKVILDRLVKA